MSEYVSLVPGLKAEGGVYDRGQPVDDAMPGFYILQETGMVAHRATPEGRTAAEEYERALTPAEPPDAPAQEQRQDDDEGSTEETEPSASKAAKELAEAHGLSLAGVVGTGSGGIITKTDVEGALPAGG